MPDKRTHIRFNIGGFVNMNVEGDRAKIFKGDLVDMAFGGFSVNLQEKIDAGTIVEFDLVTDAWSSHLTGRGRIKRVSENKRYDTRSFLIGVEFIEPNEDQVVLLVSKIRKKISEQRMKKRELKPPDVKDYVY